MKRETCLLLFVILAVFINCSNEDEETSIDPLFKITSIEPESGPVGTSVVIIGVGFSNVAAENEVKFNGEEATIVSATETSLTVEVPQEASTGNITVSRDGKTTEGPEFTVTDPSPTQTYFITFKLNGIAKVFETSNPGYQSCGECACCIMPVLNDERNADMNICNDENDWVKASDIVSWNGDKLTFNTLSIPRASFGFTEAGEYYSTSNVTDQTGSEVNITSVVADGNFFGKLMYKVSGNFKCKVAKFNGPTLNITEGTFVIRFSED